MTAAEIHEERTRLKLSQTQFARLVGARSYRTVQDWEAGRRQPPADLERRLYLGRRDADGLTMLLLEETRRAGWTLADERKLVGLLNECVTLAERCQPS